MPNPIINLEDIELRPRPAALCPKGEATQRFDARMGFIGPLVGARLLGYNLTELAPGKRAFPFHNHRVNEEMFLILEGKGELRFGSETFSIRKGDIIACPPGGTDTAHQIINTGETAMTYLAVSTKLSPEIAEYPDSGKFGILGEFPESQDGLAKHFRFVQREQNSLAYWDDE